MIYDVEQNTDEWLELRKNKFTSSTFGNLFMGKSTKGYDDLINKVVFERITDKIPESFSNNWTDRGHELESLALESYELETFRKVIPVGFVELNEWIGCSPDGFVGNDGMVQVKCPKYTTQINYILSQKIPKNYYWQMIGELYITKRKWNDFYSFHPELPSVKIRLKADDSAFFSLEAELEIAIEKAKERINKIKDRYESNKRD